MCGVSSHSPRHAVKLITVALVRILKSWPVYVGGVVYIVCGGLFRCLVYFPSESK